MTSTADDQTPTVPDEAALPKRRLSGGEYPPDVYRSPELERLLAQYKVGSRGGRGKGGEGK